MTEYCKNKLLSLILAIILCVSAFASVSAAAEDVSVLEEGVNVANIGATQNQLNMVARADYMYGITWVAQQTVAGWSGTFYKGNTYRIPYGQPINSGKYIGYGATVEEFLTAAATAGSIFYTTPSYYTGTKAPYYVTDCSSFVSWVWGISRTTTYFIPNYTTKIGAVTVSNATYSLQLGDALNSDAHVVMVTGLEYNSNGAISQIEITEQTPPQMKRSYYTPSQLYNKYYAYAIYRYYGTVPTAPGYLGNTLEGQSPIYLGENFDGFIKHSATGNLVSEIDGYLYSDSPNYVENQRWHFVYNADDGSYSILNDAKNQWIDVPYANYENNTHLWLCDYNGGTPQRFYLYFIDGYFYFRTVGSGKVFDLNGYNNQLELCGEDTGTTDAAHNARSFEILKINNDYSHWYYNLGTNNSVFIRNNASGKLMTVSGNSVIFSDPTYGEEQRWIMSQRDDGSYEFKSVSTGLYLDVLYGGLVAGTTVDVCAWNGLRPQGFYVLPNEQWEGNYYLKPCYSNTVCHMDASGLDLTLQALNKNDTSSINAQTFEVIMDGIYHNSIQPTYLGDSFDGYLTGKYSGNTLTDVDGVTLEARPTTYADNQLFHFEYDSSTLTYKITGNSGNCIDVTYTYYTDESAMGMYPDNGWVAQKFRFYQVDGYLYMSPFYTNRLVDVNNYNNTTVQLYGIDMADYRAFKLTKKETSAETELVLKSDSKLLKDGTDLSKVVSGDVASVVLSQFDNTDIQVCDVDGNTVDGAVAVGTGYTVNLLAGGAVIDSVVIIISGDVTGEGVVDATDYLRIKSNFLGSFNFETAFGKAADVDGNGIIDSTDYLRVKAHFLGTYNLYD